MSLGRTLHSVRTYMLGMRCTGRNSLQYWRARAMPAKNVVLKRKLLAMLDFSVISAGLVSKKYELHINRKTKLKMNAWIE